ncbi:MAG: aldo/keto reductase [Planctomycetes bacterium]|nr:aldo/keto reductase [Planctomycetota bacterium]
MCDQMLPANDTNHDCSRRQFITTALAGAGILAVEPQWLSAAERKKGQRKKKAAAQGQAAGGQATDIVTLGATGIKTTRIAQGTGWNGGGRSSEHSRLGQEAFTKLVRHSIDQGIAFVDTADLYGTMPYLGRALKGVPQDKYIALSKIWPREEYWNMPSGGAIKEVDRFRKELNRDVLDICLIHCMTDSAWPTTYARIRDELSELKQKGVVRAVGVSCHDVSAIKAAAALPWTDVILARINNVGKEAQMDASPEEVAPILKQARANGKVVLGMKIFGAGQLTGPEQKDASLKYVFQNGLVDAVTIGMLKPQEVDDTLQRMTAALKA